MKVGHVTERSDSSTASSFLDNDELERTGIDLGTTGRLQLMARLAEGSLLLHHFCMDSTGLKKKIPFLKEVQISLSHFVTGELSDILFQVKMIADILKRTSFV